MGRVSARFRAQAHARSPCECSSPFTTASLRRASRTRHASRRALLLPLGACLPRDPRCARIRVQSRFPDRSFQCAGESSAPDRRRRQHDYFRTRDPGSHDPGRACRQPNTRPSRPCLGRSLLRSRADYAGAVRHALVYVLKNRQKHNPNETGVDPFSSAAWFDGWRERIHKIQRPSPVIRPRTWLASAGWRRHGLLSLTERPRGSP